MIIHRAGLFVSPTALRAADPSEEIIDALMHARSVRIDRHLRHAFGFAGLTDRLADH